MKKYIAPRDFINSNIGTIKAGEVELKETPAVKDLVTAGYLQEYKTKVVHQKPAKPKKEKVIKKKKAKKWTDLV